MLLFNAGMNHYNIIRQQVAKTYPQRSAAFHGDEAKKLYDIIKTTKTDDKSLADAVDAELKRLRELATQRKTESLMYFIKASEAKPKKLSTDPSTSATNVI